MISIVDTDLLIGLIDPKDALHKRTKQIVDSLSEYNADIILLPTTLGEFVTLATIRIGKTKTQQAVERIVIEKRYMHFDITERIRNDGLLLYLSQTSKENSLFDCFVMVVAKHIHADFILSFDKGYTKNGFLLASDFVQKIKN